MSAERSLWLGTALWGWGVDERTAHCMIDIMVERGNLLIDTATNYPINGNAADYGAAISYLETWTAANKATNLEVFCKYGSVNNLGDDYSDLSRTKTLETARQLRRRLGESLFGLGIHWDNRSDKGAITETLSAIMELTDTEGLAVGFSGVAHPNVYAAVAPDIADSWWIQVKENVQTSKARDHYTPFFPNARFLAYGMNMGGVKSSDADARGPSSLALRGLSSPPIVQYLHEFLTTDHGIEPRPTNLNELALAMTFSNERLSGAIVGPRNPDQLIATMDFWDRLKEVGPNRNVRDILMHYIETKST